MNKSIVAAIAGLTLALVLGVWGYSAYQEQQIRSAILTLVTTALDACARTDENAQRVTRLENYRGSAKSMPKPRRRR